MAGEFPLLGGERCAFMKFVTAAAEGATFTSGAQDNAVLVVSDLLRFSVLGAREAHARSFASVYAGITVYFLKRGFRGVKSSAAANTDDGFAMPVRTPLWDSVYVINPAKQTLLHTFETPPQATAMLRQISVSSDGFIFAADSANNHVLIYTADFKLHGVVGADLDLRGCCGVSATTSLIAVSEERADRICIMNRADGSLLRRIGSSGWQPGRLKAPSTLCFMGDVHHIAVFERENYRISVFATEGVFIRVIAEGIHGVGMYMAFTRFDELVALFWYDVQCGFPGNKFMIVSNDETLILDPVKQGEASYTCFDLHGGCIYAHRANCICDVFE